MVFDIGPGVDGLSIDGQDAISNFYPCSLGGTSRLDPREDDSLVGIGSVRKIDTDSKLLIEVVTGATEGGTLKFGTDLRSSVRECGR